MNQKRRDEAAVGALLIAGLLVAAGVFFVLGAWWHAQVVPPVELYTPMPTVTAQTVAPAVPAEVQP